MPQTASPGEPGAVLLDDDVRRHLRHEARLLDDLTDALAPGEEVPGEEEHVHDAAGKPAGFAVPAGEPPDGVGANRAAVGVHQHKDVLPGVHERGEYRPHCRNVCFVRRIRGSGTVIGRERRDVYGKRPRF